MRKSSTTVAASSVAPMMTAPTAAMVIRVSIENGVPDRGAGNGAAADRDEADEQGGEEGPAADGRKDLADEVGGEQCQSPQAMVSTALRVFHQGRR